MPEAQALHRAVIRAIGPGNERILGPFVIGIGACAIPPDLPTHGVAAILLAGFGGALHPDLRIGDVVAQGLPDERARSIGARPGTIYTAKQIVATPAEKAELFRRIGALAVDMEADAVAPLAAKLGVPFVHVRAITDTCDQSLDPRLLRYLDPSGNVKPASLLRTLVRHPSMIFPLVRLGIHSRRAAQRLGEVVAKLAADDLPSHT
jgi:nucleoside phosphorylase